MSVARPARSLLARRIVPGSVPAPTSYHKPTAAAIYASSPSCQPAATFHSSPQLSGRRRSRFKSVRLDQIGLTTDEKIDEFAKTKFPEYTEEEKEILRQRYTPQQMDAVEAGEAAVDPRDLTIQGRLRTDPHALSYLEDFRKVRPVVDIQPPNTTHPGRPRPRWMNEHEADVDMNAWMANLIPEDLKHLLASVPRSEEEQMERQNRIDAMRKDERAQFLADEHEKFMARIKPLLEHLESTLPQEAYNYLVERSSLNDSVYPGNSALAPELGPKIPGVYGKFKADMTNREEAQDPEGNLQPLKKRMNLSISDLASIQTKVVSTRYVHNQTRLGKIRTMWIQAIAGNMDGRIGVGEAKDTETPTAEFKAKLLAIQNMRPVARYEQRTVFGNVEAKVGATIVKMSARPPGFGLRASPRLYEVFRFAGIRDIACSLPRGRNPMNSVKACFQALATQQNPEALAYGRGKKFVDARKVYFGGNVL